MSSGLSLSAGRARLRVVGLALEAKPLHKHVMQSFLVMYELQARQDMASKADQVLDLLVLPPSSLA